GLALGFAFGLGLETAAFISLAPAAFSAETETDFIFFFAGEDGLAGRAVGSLKELFTFTSLSLATSFFSWRSRTFLKLAGRFFCLSSMNFAMAGWLEPVRSFSVTIASLIICRIHRKISDPTSRNQKIRKKKRRGCVGVVRFFRAGSIGTTCSSTVAMEEFTEKLGNLGEI
ncbi:myo-inositol oxygenase 1, partial [Striga asiatica]